MHSALRSNYGWLIVAVATFSLLVSNGLSIGGIPIFYKPIQADLIAAGVIEPDQAQSVFGFAPALTFLLAGFLAPVAGGLLQRLTPKIMMILGCFILGGALALYSQAGSTLAIYIAHALLGTSLGFVGVLVSTVLVSRWFATRRGLALGIVFTGTSLGGVVISQMAAPLIASYGWRNAMLLVSLLVWLVLLPAVILIVREPENVSVESGNDSSPELTGFRLGEALRQPAFWILSLCAAAVFYALFVVTQQLNLYLQSPRIGFTPAEAARVQSLLFLLSICGKFLYGFLADRLSTIRVMLISAATMFLSTLAFLALDGTTVYVFAALFGLNYGGTFVLLQLLVAEYFGLKEYPKILGVITVIETMGGAAGSILTGRIADANGGDYSSAFQLLILITGISLVLTVVLNLVYSPARVRAA